MPLGKDDDYLEPLRQKTTNQNERHVFKTIAGPGTFTPGAVFAVTGTPPWRVAVIEDHPDSCQALADAVAQLPDMNLVGTADDIDEGLALIQRTQPHVLVVDLGLPSGSGLALIREARHLLGGACAAAVLTLTGNETHLLKAIRAGANGYMFKSDDEVTWQAALRTLANGGGLLHHGLARHLLGEPAISRDAQLRSVAELLSAGYSAGEAATRLAMSETEFALHISRAFALLRTTKADLTRRETELIRLLDQGFSFRDSAGKMGIQESTAKTHAANMYQKLGATNLQEALYAARREHLLR